MLFKDHGECPKNTCRDNPHKRKLKVMKGQIIQWHLFFPTECSNLLYVTVEYKHRQIFPANPNEAMMGGGQTFNIPEKLELDSSPYVLDIYSWNLDTDVAHNYYLHVNVEPPDPVVVEETGDKLYDRIKRVLGGL